MIKEKKKSKSNDHQFSNITMSNKLTNLERNKIFQANQNKS
jgi:hypothetical protein